MDDETRAEIEEALDRALLYVGTTEHLEATVRARLEVLAVDLWRAFGPTFEQLVEMVASALRLLGDVLRPALDAIGDFLDSLSAAPPPPVWVPAPVRPTSYRLPATPPRVTPQRAFLTHHRRTR